MSRNYKIKDIKKLFSLSGNQCAEPNCKNRIIGEDGTTVVGEICHITAANTYGPRYNADLTEDERRSYDNLILLCPEHHKLIDNPQNQNVYTESLLKQWKEDHIRNFNEFPVSDELAKTAIDTINVQPVINVVNTIHVNDPNKETSKNTKIDEFLIENLNTYRKGQFFDIYMYGSAVIIAFGIFSYLIFDYRDHTEPLNPINLFRTIPVLPIKFCVDSWKLSRKKIRECRLLINKYDKWVRVSNSGDLNPDQHNTLSEKFDKIREIK